MFPLCIAEVWTLRHRRRVLRGADALGILMTSDSRGGTPAEPGTPELAEDAGAPPANRLNAARCERMR